MGGGASSAGKESAQKNSNYSASHGGKRVSMPESQRSSQSQRPEPTVSSASAMDSKSCAADAARSSWPVGLVGAGAAGQALRQNVSDQEKMQVDAKESTDSDLKTPEKLPESLGSQMDHETESSVAAKFENDGLLSPLKKRDMKAIAEDHELTPIQTPKTPGYKGFADKAVPSYPQQRQASNSSGPSWTNVPINTQGFELSAPQDNMLIRSGNLDGGSRRTSSDTQIRAQRSPVSVRSLRTASEGRLRVDPRRNTDARISFCTEDGDDKPGRALSRHSAASGKSPGKKRSRIGYGSDESMLVTDDLRVSFDKSLQSPPPLRKGKKSSTMPVYPSIEIVTEETRVSSDSALPSPQLTQKGSKGNSNHVPAIDTVTDDARISFDNTAPSPAPKRKGSKGSSNRVPAVDTVSDDLRVSFDNAVPSPQPKRRGSKGNSNRAPAIDTVSDDLRVSFDNAAPSPTNRKGLQGSKVEMPVQGIIDGGPVVQDNVMLRGSDGPSWTNVHMDLMDFDQPPSPAGRRPKASSESRLPAHPCNPADARPSFCSEDEVQRRTPGKKGNRIRSASNNELTEDMRPSFLSDEARPSFVSSSTNDFDDFNESPIATATTFSASSLTIWADDPRRNKTFSASSLASLVEVEELAGTDEDLSNDRQSFVSNLTGVDEPCE